MRNGKIGLEIWWIAKLPLIWFIFIVSEKKKIYGWRRPTDIRATAVALPTQSSGAKAVASRVSQAEIWVSPS